jgi:TetR/AcrR family transcriptional regulator, fatty acid biosynthesis regulator
MKPVNKLKAVESKKVSRLDQKEETRRHLVNVALKLSSERSFASLSLREVAAGAGITAAGFYRHFHSMEELGLVLVDEVGLSLRRMLRDARKKVSPGPEAIELSIETFLDFIRDNQNLFRLFLGERQGASATFRKAIHTEMDRFISELSIDLDRLQSELKQPLRDSSLTAEAIVAVAFTVGAEALDLPKHKQAGLSLRLIEEVKMIFRGSLMRKK